MDDDDDNDDAKEEDDNDDDDQRLQTVLLRWLNILVHRVLRYIGKLNISYFIRLQEYLIPRANNCAFRGKGYLKSVLPLHPRLQSEKGLHRVEIS